MVLALKSQSKLMNKWDLDARLAENYNSTFGELVKIFVASTDPKPVGFDDRLQKALRQRNDLAHQYFWDRGIKFCSNNGRAEMLAELHQMQKEFTTLDDDLAELIEARIQQQGQNIEAFRTRIADSLREMIAGTREPHNPERVPNPIELIGAEVWRPNLSEPGNLVLITRDGKYLIPGEKGLCYGPPEPPSGSNVVTHLYERAFPATINPRPKTEISWNYGIPLANGYILRAETKPDNAAHEFYVSIKRSATRNKTA